MTRIISWVMYTYDQQEWWGSKKWLAVARITAAYQLKACTKAEMDEAFKLIGYDPKHEKWLFRNPPAAMSERRGLESATNKIERFHEDANARTRVGTPVEHVWAVGDLVKKRVSNAASEGRQRSAFERARKAGGPAELGSEPCTCAERAHWIALYRAHDFPCPHRAGFIPTLEAFPALDTHRFPAGTVIEEPEPGTSAVLALWEGKETKGVSDLPSYPGDRDAAAEDTADAAPQDAFEFCRATSLEVVAVSKRVTGNMAGLDDGERRLWALSMDYERSFPRASPSAVDAFQLEFWRTCWISVGLRNQLDAAIASVVAGTRVGWATKEQMRAAGAMPV